MMQQGTGSGADRAASVSGVKRSHIWKNVKDKHLAVKGQTTCAICGDTTTPQVHHIVPFHFCHLVYRGDLELDERNLMTLCEVQENNHHLLIGHLGDWEIYNPVGRDAMIAAFKGLPTEELTADKIQLMETWINWMNGIPFKKPVRWLNMPLPDRQALRKFLDDNLPYKPTDDNPSPPAPYPFMEGGDDRKNPDYIATTYGEESRLKVFLSQLEKAAITSSEPQQSPGTRTATTTAMQMQ
jgi:hypothetical protein